MAQRVTYEHAEIPDRHVGTAHRLTSIVYALLAIGLFIGITFIAAPIVNYIKMNEVKGTWLESHFKWQLRTFWFAVGAAIIGYLFTFVNLGWLVFALLAIWVVYRIVKGWIYLSDGREMYMAGATKT